MGTEKASGRKLRCTIPLRFANHLLVTARVQLYIGCSYGQNYCIHTLLVDQIVMKKDFFNPFLHENIIELI